MTQTILIVDDEQDMLDLLKRSLKKDLKCKVVVAPSGEVALERLAQGHFDLMLADIRMPGMGGLDLLAQAKQQDPRLTVIMMTGYGRIELAVEAMKQGAYDFITKPFDHDALVVRLEKALERSRLMAENLRLQRECGSNVAFKRLVGQSEAMQKVFVTIQMVAQTDLTALITGESGTGKDLAARSIHALSQRAEGPFVAINCPTLPENILESELFGYKKGAFTHATQNKIGLFQEANGGSIFLDEIGDISPVIQTKLLRVLQEKEIKPLGDTKSIKVDVRIIASTNQDLAAKIEASQFREDVFYRLNVLPIKMPSLSERTEDIPLIANFLLAKHCKEMNKPLKRISAPLMEILVTRQWKGNVRQLENTIMRGILFAAGDEILTADVELAAQTVVGGGKDSNFLAGLPYKAAKEQTLNTFNARYIGRILMDCQGNVTQAAKRCGLERQALQQIMRRYDIQAEAFRS
jgi:DNA-binding NtrC family response regulator